MAFVHLHRPCIIASRLMPNGYPAGSLHRKTLEDQLGRPLRDGYETHHRCENKACIEPTHLEEKETFLHRSEHLKGNQHAVGTVFAEDEIERRRERGRANIHHASDKAYTKTTRSAVSRKTWANRTPEERAEIGRKISEAKRRLKGVV